MIRETVQEICQRVAMHHGIPVRALWKQKGEKIYARPRAEAMAVIRRELGWAYQRIGEHFGGFHHTSVITAIRNFDAGWTPVERIPNRETLTRDQLLSAIRTLERRVCRLERIIASRVVAQFEERHPTVESTRDPANRGAGSIH